MRERTAKALSLNQRRSNRLGGCLGVVFFGLFLVVGSIFLYILAFRPLWGVLSARHWVESPCRVVSSKVEVNRNGDGDTYRIRIVYNYMFAGRPFTSDQYNFMGNFSSSGRAGKQKVVDRYPPGRQAVCYVNPDTPQEAVLVRGLTADMLWGLFPIPFVAIGAGGLFYLAFRSGTPDPRAGPAALSTRDAGRSSSLRENAADDLEDGPCVLKPEASPLGKFLVAVFFACFWNGIVAAFVYQVYESFERGKPEWFLALFMTPFVAVGIGLVLWVVYLFVALFNPRPVLTLSRRRIPLGGAARLTWTFSGHTGSLRRLKVTLKGEEQATYIRGTTTHTDKQAFSERVLLETEDPLEIAEGRAEVLVPSDSMHSFAADNNKIVWCIALAGEIPLRPDVNAEFSIQVTPHESIAY